jgi:hypothetical protein
MNAEDECAENIRILERGFDAFLNEYREQAEIWKTLETKAQARNHGWEKDLSAGPTRASCSACPPRRLNSTLLLGRGAHLLA